MTEQDKREKVVQGLKWCMNEEHDCYREKGCPYENEGEDVGCKYALHRDALELLKAQEPRVMIWQDVIGAAIECKPLYIEVKDSEDKEPGDDRWAMVTQYGDSLTNGMICAMSSYITRETLFKDWYNKTWRCWTTKPSLKQMEETPWQ